MTRAALPMLRALHAHPEGLSTPELAGMFAADVRPHQRALTICGTVMRDREQRGHVCRAGTKPGAWQRGPAIIWRITSLGAAELIPGLVTDLRAAGNRQEGERVRDEILRAAHLILEDRLVITDKMLRAARLCVREGQGEEVRR